MLVYAAQLVTPAPDSAFMRVTRMFALLNLFTCGDSVGVTVGVGVCEAVHEDVGDVVRDCDDVRGGVRVSVPDADAVYDADDVTVLDAVVDGDWVTEGVAGGVCDALGVKLGVCVAVMPNELDGEDVAVADIVLDADDVADNVGVLESDVDEVEDTVGRAVFEDVADSDAVIELDAVMDAVLDGEAVRDGVCVGLAEADGKNGDSAMERMTLPVPCVDVVSAVVVDVDVS